MLLLALYIEARYVWIPDVPIKLDVHTSRKPIERVVPGCGRAKNHEDVVELMGSNPLVSGDGELKVSV